MARSEGGECERENYVALITPLTFPRPEEQSPREPNVLAALLSARFFVPLLLRQRKKKRRKRCGGGFIWRITDTVDLISHVSMTKLHAESW